MTHTHPNNIDSDGDGISDGLEVALAFNPLDEEDLPKVTVNAVMNDPDETGLAWVELYSASTRSVELGSLRLETGVDGSWSNAVSFETGTSIHPGRCLLVAENGVTNADVSAQSGLFLPATWPTTPSAGVRLAWGNGGEGEILDAVLIGRNSVTNAGALETTGWLSSTGARPTQGSALVRWFPGADTDRWRDWTTEAGREGRNSQIPIDTDGDGLSDAEEWTGSANTNAMCFGDSTNPWNADSDGDGLSDSEECRIWCTNPNAWATDGDIWPWMPDGTVASNWPGSDSFELAHDMNPLVADANSNGIPDSWEWVMGSDALQNGTDSDGDGVADLAEIRQNSNPQDASDSAPKPFVVHCESSLAGWENGVATNDVGFRGFVRVSFFGAAEGQGVCVSVTEGYYFEPFVMTWQNAEPVAEFEGDTQSQRFSSAILSPNSSLVVRDAGTHPEYYGTLGGEYAITNFTATLVPDWNRDSQIDESDRCHLLNHEIFHFWINNDNDEGPIGDENSDIPYYGTGLFGNADCRDDTVDGECDLLDFFPVWLDVQNIMDTLPSDITFKLRQEENAFNVLFSQLTTSEACDYLRNTNALYGINLQQLPREASVSHITAKGVELPSMFVEQIRTNASQGIVLLEGCKENQTALFFEAWKGSERLFTTALPVRIYNVEDFYDWVNFRSTADPEPWMDAGPPNVVFIHGANVTVDGERAWASEIFKRLWWCGAEFNFYPVRWQSDMGASWNYHANAENAFSVAARFGSLLASSEGRNIILAHSLGSVVASAALCDYGGTADKLILLNSAIPSEAFDSSLFDPTPANHLVHDEWIDYTNVCWSARWNELFPVGDARHDLTWRGRFASVSPVAVNFHSTGDEVLELYADAHNPEWYNGVSPSGNWGERYSWHKQELWKGRESLLGFMGTTDWSGWGFKTTWLGTRSWSASEANAVGNPAVFTTNTVFAPTPDSITNATATRLQTDAHLARGIPALSPATGRISLSGGDDEIMPSYDMNSPTFMVNAWPRPGNTGLHGRFLHSDIKNAAFLFVHPVFERIVEIGDLPP